jgi:hypothetical protein
MIERMFVILQTFFLTPVSNNFSSDNFFFAKYMPNTAANTQRIFKKYIYIQKWSLCIFF